MDVLVDKSYKEYKRLSRYMNFPYYYNTLDKKYIYGTTAQLKDTTTHIIHIVKANDTFDSLALYYYGNPTYYWIICDFNHIQDPYQELVVGEEIKIPTFSMIEYLLND